MNKQKFIISFVTVFSILGCQGSIKEQEVPSEGAKKTAVEISHTDTVQQSHQSIDSINVIALKEDYQKGLLQVYNEDGTIWKSFEITDNFSDDDIMPFAQKAENRVLVFRCIGRKNNYYAVVVNEDNSIIKYIKPNNPHFTYETWEQQILKVFSVDFDPKSNPLKVEPSTGAKSLLFDEEQFYHPSEIKGEWLKVKDDDDKEGWIKWRNAKGKLIINLYYDA